MRSAHMPVAFLAAKDTMTAQANFRSSTRLRTTLNLPSRNMKANAHKSWPALGIGNGSALRGGLDEQIFGALKTTPGRGQKLLRSIEVAILGTIQR
jgi:hypothetical protein